jgi:proline racemase
VGQIPGDTMSARRLHLIERLEHLRGFLMDEPRGHAAMSGAILQPPARPDADWGVLYIESGGIHPMCGHGTMGVATVLVETGMVEGSGDDPITIRLDTPAGLVIATVRVVDGRAADVTIENVPSFVMATDVELDVPGFGSLTIDLAYGGNIYPIVDLRPIGLRFDTADGGKMLDLGRAIIDAVNSQVHPVHPERADIDHCLHVEFVTGGGERSDGRTAVANHTGYFDRSPCGTGTSARLALLHSRNEIGVGEEYVHESLLGSRFVARIVRTAEVGGRPAVVPSITGRAWITGFNQLLLDPTDPFPAGFKL